MKKNTIIPVSIIVLIAFVGIVMWSTPVSFGKNISPEMVHHIKVMDGNSGKTFTIDNPNDIKYIVQTIQNVSMKKTGISLGRMGYGLKISYLDENNKKIVPLFIMNSDNTIRKDPFLYQCESDLCFDYIKGLNSK